MFKVKLNKENLYNDSLAQMENWEIYDSFEYVADRVFPTWGFFKMKKMPKCIKVLNSSFISNVSIILKLQNTAPIAIKSKEKDEEIIALTDDQYQKLYEFYCANDTFDIEELLSSEISSNEEAMHDDKSFVKRKILKSKK